MTRNVAAISVMLLVSSLCSSLIAQPCEPEWGPAPAPGGRDGTVSAMLAFDDGSGAAL